MWDSSKSLVEVKEPLARQPMLWESGQQTFEQLISVMATFPASKKTSTYLGTIHCRSKKKKEEEESSILIATAMHKNLVIVYAALTSILLLPLLLLPLPLLLLLLWMISTQSVAVMNMNGSTQGWMLMSPWSVIDWTRWKLERARRSFISQEFNTLVQRYKSWTIFWPTYLLNQKRHMKPLKMTK